MLAALAELKAAKAAIDPWPEPGPMADVVHRRLERAIRSVRELVGREGPPAPPTRVGTGALGRSLLWMCPC